MGNFDRGGNRGGGFNKGGFGGKPSFSKKSFGNDSDRPREMFKATCSECGKNCEVPFRPTNGKPVRCDDCFSVERNSDSRGGRDSYNDRAPRREFNNDRGAFRPQLDRPAFVPANSGSNDNTTKTLAEISTKLDRLVSAIEKMTTSVSSTSAPKTETKKSETVATPKKVEVKAEPKKVEAKTAAKKAPAKKVEVKAPAKVAAKKAAPAKKVVAKKKK